MCATEKKKAFATYYKVWSNTKFHLRIDPRAVSSAVSLPFFPGKSVQLVLLLLFLAIQTEKIYRDNNLENHEK